MIKRTALVAMLLVQVIAAQAADVGTRYGVGAILGSSYDPTGELTFATVSALIIYDYEGVFAHPAPEPLRFKLEADAGMAWVDDPRFTASANFMALYFLDSLRFGKARPYVEAGAGVIYTDHRVEGQGLRFNFNPTLGAGLLFEEEGEEGSGWFLAVRPHHVSNGGLHRDNRGVNSITLNFGYLF